MATIKVYEYKKCGSCLKAKKFLNESGIEVDFIPIEESAPSRKELKKMLSFYEGNLKKLFNTSGKLYREFKIKDKIGAMSEDEALDLLAAHGMLVKRPFLLTKDLGLVGFKADQWAQLL